MNDPYPAYLNIEIDRPLLKKYLCMKYFLAWAFIAVFIGGFLGVVEIQKTVNLRAQVYGVISRAALTSIVVKCMAKGVGCALLVAFVCYLVFGHRRASQIAASLEVSVEGAFLRIRQYQAFVSSDRKLHFRAIVDYATTQDTLMRHFGLYALQMTTPAGGPHSTLVIHGIKDCLKVRDMLSEIDRLRENQ